MDADPGSVVVHPLTLVGVLVGGVRGGHGVAMRDDLRSAGVTTVTPDDGEALRLAELRVTTGLKLPDCCVLDVALHHQARLATVDAALAAAARGRGISVLS